MAVKNIRMLEKTTTLGMDSTFKVQRTWTELTEFFLQKTKRKKPKLPYEELDMKIGCGVR
ncbi:hypothetical protein T4E_9066 [Trichinella pseudospiralis]|uniref:Uncharacterized protein n=1 Tax=Trichinella pseudospiralis TaxID=6337 RepID=A0A0V0XQ13_TRIPS|nr:hypothetical protein T4E_9066 [Trichinella pseudospiralis]